jgi:hypothetical protein
MISNLNATYFTKTREIVVTNHTQITEASIILLSALKVFGIGGVAV